VNFLIKITSLQTHWPHLQVPRRPPQGRTHFVPSPPADADRSHWHRSPVKPSLHLQIPHSTELENQNRRIKILLFFGFVLTKNSNSDKYPLAPHKGSLPRLAAPLSHSHPHLRWRLTRRLSCDPVGVIWTS